MDLDQIANELNRKEKEIEELREKADAYQDKVLPKLKEYLETQDRETFIAFYRNLKTNVGIKYKLYEWIKEKDKNFFNR